MFGEGYLYWASAPNILLKKFEYQQGTAEYTGSMYGTEIVLFFIKICFAMQSYLCAEQ